MVPPSTCCDGHLLLMLVKRENTATMLLCDCTKQNTVSVERWIVNSPDRKLHFARSNWHIKMDATAWEKA